MNKFLHISFTFNEGLPKVQELEPLFNALAPDWMRYSPNCWIVWTARPASDFQYAIRPLIGQSDSLLIVKLDMNERNGWQPQWVWEWMDRKRELGPPPPPALPSSDLPDIFNALSSSQYPYSNALQNLLTPPKK